MWTADTGAAVIEPSGRRTGFGFRRRYSTPQALQNLAQKILDRAVQRGGELLLELKASLRKRTCQDNEREAG
jgi:hypothetical protein